MLDKTSFRGHSFLDVIQRGVMPKKILDAELDSALCEVVS